MSTKETSNDNYLLLGNIGTSDVIRFLQQNIIYKYLFSYREGQNLISALMNT